MGAPNLIADSMEYGLSYSVISYLKKLSQQVMLRSRAIKYFEWFWLRCLTGGPNGIRLY